MYYIKPLVVGAVALVFQLGLAAAGAHVTHGFTATQIFSTLGYDPNEAGEPAPCGIVATQTLWYAAQAHTIGNWVFSTSNSTMDTVLGVYTGPGDDFATLSNAGCNDDFGSDTTSHVVVFSGTPGTIYWIQAGRKAGTGTSGSLKYTERWIPFLFTGDSDSMTVSTNSIEVFATNGLSCGTVNCSIATTYQYWVQLDVLDAGTLTVDTVGSASGFDTVLAVYSGWAPLDQYSLTPLACNDDYSGLGTKSKVVVSVNQTTVWVQVGGKSGTRGTLKLNYSLAP